MCNKRRSIIFNCKYLATFGALNKPTQAEYDKHNHFVVPENHIEDKYMRIMLVGDCVIQTRSKPSGPLKDIIDECDLVMGNIETLFHKGLSYPERYYGQGCPMISDPGSISTVNEYKMHLASHANNHSNDYGVGGLLESIESLSHQGIEVAGVGLDYEDASRIKTVVTQNGCVGLLASTSSYAHWGAASKSNNFIRGRPGVIGLRVKPKPSLLLSKGIMRIQEKINLKSSMLRKLLLFGDYRLSREDVVAIINTIKEVRKSFEGLVLYSHHSHKGFPEYAPGFLRHFAHDCIDAGVDVFFSHGTHQLRGIEVYGSKPIFYGLGNFVSQTHKISSFPEDYLDSIQMGGHDALSIQEKILSGRVNKSTWWESIGVIIETDHRKLLKTKVVPLNLFGDGEVIGLPQLANEEKSTAILKHIMNLSKQYDTMFEYGDKCLIVNGVC